MTSAGRLALTAALILAAGTALAQEAPPAERPPARPEASEAEVSEAEAAPPSEDAAEAEEPLPPEDELIGPPAPPAWFLLAGSDADHAACLSALRRSGAAFTEPPAITEAETRDCGIARPVQVTRLLRGVDLPDAPVLRCQTAVALAGWTRDFLVPAARAALPDAPLTALRTGPGYVCRDRVGTGDADPPPSEHALGNAIDVMSFELEGREPLPVRPRAEDGDADAAFQRAAQATGCLFFTTVLGPGSNAAHDDHLHLDLSQRSSGWRVCD